MKLYAAKMLGYLFSEEPIETYARKEVIPEKPGRRSFLNPSARNPLTLGSE